MMLIHIRRLAFYTYMSHGGERSGVSLSFLLEQKLIDMEWPEPVDFMDTQESGLGRKYQFTKVETF